MKTIDLFSGVGGLSLGLEMAGFETILAVEKDAAIASGFVHNFPHAQCFVGDITKIKPSEYKKLIGNQAVDLIVGGPPCQGFSQKGKRLSLEDERNFLFKYYLKVVSTVRPKAFLIENVPNLLSTSDGYFYNQILSALKNLNYKISSTVLNAADYGVPQSRRRAFIVGVQGDQEFKFPEPQKKKVSVSDAISDLPPLLSGEGAEFFKYNSPSEGPFQKIMRKGSKGVYNHQATKHSAVALQRLALIPENGGKEHLPAEHLTKSIYSGTWCRLKSDGQAATITTRFDTPSSGQFTLPSQDRCLTVREAARIQSFPDNFIFTGTKSNQMLQVGNAVPPLLAKAVGDQLYKHLENLLDNASYFEAA